METEVAEQTEDRVTKGIVAKYNITDASLSELREKYIGLKISGPLDKTGYAVVAAAKSELVKLRTAVESTRKNLKANALEYGRKVDGEARRITMALEAIEEPLVAEKARIDALVQAEKDRRQQEINDRVNSRMAALNAVNGAGSVRYELLPAMPETDFQAHLAVATAKHEDAERIKAEQEAEIARLRKAEEEQKAKEAEALAVQRREMVEVQAKIDAQRKDQETKEAALKAEADRLDREKREAEDKKRREEEAKAHAAEIEKAREEAALKAKTEAEEAAQRKAMEDAEAKVRAEAEAKEAARKEEARRSDKEKLAAYLSSVREIQIPRVRDTKMEVILNEFTNAIVAFDKALS